MCALLFIYISLALLVSFICSLLEATLLTITPASIASAKQKGRRWAERMEVLKNDVERPLSAILTLNTIADMQVYARILWHERTRCMGIHLAEEAQRSS